MSAQFTVDAVAFDLDGTLLDTVHDLAFAVNRLLSEQRLPALAKQRIATLVGKGMANLVGRAVHEARGDPPGAPELARLLARYQVLYAESLGRETVVFPGVVEGLQRLRAAGFRLAVITNKASRFVAPHLALAGIANYFDIAVGGDDAPAKKPDPSPLLVAAQRLGVAPPRLLMVGDSSNDARAARAAGCPVLMVPYGYNEGMPVDAVESDGIVESLCAVADRVRRDTQSALA
jgi:phosphoglycolate phosphatase